MTGRRTGWKSRRSLHVIEAKAPAFCEDDTLPWDDDCDDDGWHGCREQGCCIDEDWAVYFMPPMVFGMDGLVHISQPRDPTSICGEEGNWPIPSVTSTDEALSYGARFAGSAADVTCLRCITSALFWNLSWRHT